MENTLQNIKGVFCFLDDISIVSKGSIENHNKKVEKVFHKLDEEGFALNLSNFEITEKTISWLGFVICETGYQNEFSEVKDPNTRKQIHSFIGVFNHLQKFLRNLYNLTKQFRLSLKISKNQKLVWGLDQQKAFKDTLKLISNIIKV